MRIKMRLAIPNSDLRLSIGFRGTRLVFSVFIEYSFQEYQSGDSKLDTY
jgi:hypothetical protein